MSDLMQKLVMAKKVMEAHDRIPRGQSAGDTFTQTSYEEPQPIMEQPQQPSIQQTMNVAQPYDSSRVMNSKLPDEIKKLMIENPIVQPSLNGPTLSDDLVEKASRLMNDNKRTTSTAKISESPSFNMNELRNMVRDTVRDTVRDVIKEELKSLGVITESTSKTNDRLELKVGKHIFEGKVTSIKKIQ